MDRSRQAQAADREDLSAGRGGAGTSRSGGAEGYREVVAATVGRDPATFLEQPQLRKILLVASGVERHQTVGTQERVRRDQEIGKHSLRRSSAGSPPALSVRRETCRGFSPNDFIEHEFNLDPGFGQKLLDETE